jgi:hypothetical protein
MSIYLTSLASSPRRRTPVVPTARVVGTRPQPAPPPPVDEENQSESNDNEDDDEAEEEEEISPDVIAEVIVPETMTSSDEASLTPSASNNNPAEVVDCCDTAIVYALPLELLSKDEQKGNKKKHTKTPKQLASVLQVLDAGDIEDQATAVTTPWDGIRDSNDTLPSLDGTSGNHHHRPSNGNGTNTNNDDNHNQRITVSDASTTCEKIRPYIVLAFPVILLAAVGYIAYGTLTSMSSGASDDEEAAAAALSTFDDGSNDMAP